MDFSEPQHKKAIGIMYIIFSAMGLLGVFFYDFFMTAIFDYAEIKDPQFAEVSWIFDLIASFIWGLAFLFLLPRLVIGVGLVQGRSWANVPGLVFGVITLINFPIGTLVGIYAILAFTAKPKDEVEAY